jgi:hypothetical protein
MLYAPLAELMENNKVELARRSAQVVIDRKLRLYSEMPLEQLTKLLTPVIEMIIRYLRTGDVQEWSGFVARVSDARRKEGYSAQEVNAVGSTITEKILEMIEEKLPGPGRQAERERYIRRVKGLDSLAGVSSISTHMKNKD